jgi:hypothetical protein
LETGLQQQGLWISRLGGAIILLAMTLRAIALENQGLLPSLLAQLKAIHPPGAGTTGSDKPIPGAGGIGIDTGPLGAALNAGAGKFAVDPGVLVSNISMEAISI